MSNLKKNCVICNVEFSPKRNDAKVCSAKCRQKNWRRKKEFNACPPPEEIQHLIEKIKWLEAENAGLITTNTNLSVEVDKLKEYFNATDPTGLIDAYTDQKNPNTSLKFKKPTDIPKKEDKGGKEPYLGADVVFRKHPIKKSYNQWLNLAKEIELQDEKEEFERELVADTSINARQKDMIRSKIKK
jgi:hypothetical protein